MDTVGMLKALADETRLRIVNLLARAGESDPGDLCACEIEAILALNQSNASRHLGRLRQAGIVSATRKGHWVHFTLASSTPHGPLVRTLVKRFREENPVCMADLERLTDYRSSGYTCETIGTWAARPGFLRNT